MADRTRWGILGTGAIARKFALALKGTPGAELVACGSRAKETAEAFGREFEIPRCHASYTALAEDPGVDVVYVSTPHPMHAENTALCLRHGKHVLCEKPFAVNATEARAMVDAAREENRFLMEAMWTRFLPAIVRAREWLREGRIGDPRMVSADFGFRAEWNEEGRLLNPALAGGALLDVGIYPVSLASMVFGGPPASILSTAHIGPTGVDEQNAMVFRYEGGAMALLSSAVRTNTLKDAYIFGDEGRIVLHHPFWCTTCVTLVRPSGEEMTFTQPHLVNGYEFEAMEVMRCIREGLLESPEVSWSESLQLMRTLDDIRAQWGLVYPMERPEV